MKKKRKEEKTILDKIRLDFGKITIAGILLNILFLIFGVIIYMNPYITASAVGVIIGIYFIIFGLFDIYEFFMRDSSPIFKYKIFLGVLALILGIFVMVNPFNLIKILTIALGIYLIIMAIVKFIEALKMKKYGYDGWLILLVTSIILLAFGVLTTINPMASMDIIQVCGIFIILASILEVCNLIMMFTKANDIMKCFKKAR